MRLFSAATIEQAKKKIKSTPWAEEGWQAVAQRMCIAMYPVAAASPARFRWKRVAGFTTISVRSIGIPLTYDGNLPDQHRCPAGHVCTGEKYDAAWRVWRHRQIADLAREAALAYVVLGLEAGRETAVSILTQYADFYTQFDGQADAEAWMLTRSCLQSGPHRSTVGSSPDSRLRFGSRQPQR